MGNEAIQTEAAAHENLELFAEELRIEELDVATSQFCTAASMMCGACLWSTLSTATSISTAC